MAYSVEYKTSVAGADGTENLAAITFDYLKKSQIEVRVSNAGETLTAFKTRLAADSVSALTYPSQYTIDDNKVITLAASVLANGSTYQIEVRRNTGLTTNGVDYTDGATVTEANLDDSQTHLRQMVQELEDNKVTLLEDGTIAASISGSADTVVNLGTHNVTELADVTDAGSGAIITSSERTKLTNIEDNATADQTGAEIKTAYEGESDTNAFTDAEKTKLGTVYSGAQVNVQSDWDAISGDAQILNKPTVPSSIDDLSDVSTSGVSSGQVLKWSGSAWTPQNDLTGSGTGASTFLGLSDTPSSLTAGKWLKVNSLGNALEEADDPSGISDVVDDTTPQLGGDLDVGDNEINTSTSNGNIALNPNGTGYVEVKGDGTTSGTAGAIRLNCSNNTHGVKIQSPAHSASASYILTLPTDVGTEGQVLSTDGTTGDAALSWTSLAATGNNSDITQLSGLTTAIAVNQGGTGATTDSDARTNLGLAIGTDVMAHADNNAVYDTQQAWTATQRSAFYTSYADDTTTFYTDTAQNWTWTVTSSGASGVTFELNSTTTALTNANGQSGFILLTNAGGTISFSTSTTLTHADVVNTISGVSGTFLISYICNGTKVCLTNSKALT